MTATSSVSRSRVRRRLSVTLLNEDGSRNPYGHPRHTGELWLRLPHAYWLEGHYKSLSFPGKTLLLIALSRPDGFYLPYDRASSWYGISADTAERGLRELREHGLLNVDVEWIKNPRSDDFYIEHRTYTLIGPFSKVSQDSAAKRGAGSPGATKEVD
ncbi:hypothetical protein [Georgenia faecalis]|uniref:hypothetical protein n=1 Tax=Georgenia faecalis TaxID=2483799 RepID=UPI000FD76C21|nr:hypothetical protein [Georgenia faecalis]